MLILGKNEFVCPECLKKFKRKNFNLDSSINDGDLIEIHCPFCDCEIKAQFCTSYWIEHHETEFAKQFMALRGLSEIPSDIDTDWHFIAAYLNHFLDGKKEKIETWNSKRWNNAYKLLCEYFDKSVDTDCKTYSENDEDFEYVRNTYRVPAKKNQRILFKYENKKGTIVGADSHIHVIFDNETDTKKLHPTWEVEYLENESGGQKNDTT